MSDIAVGGVEAQEAPDLIEFVERSESGRGLVYFAVPDAYCAACIFTIEAALRAVPGVAEARVNLSRRIVRVEFEGEDALQRVPEAIRRSGYRNHPVDAREVDGKDPAFNELVRSLVVAGFATIHVMFFSEAVWSGVDPTTRQLFYWVSALVALPATIYAGRSFFRSALAALSVGRANMDVPIAIGLIATSALSLLETIVGGEHAYYDASTMLLLFLLAGRTLDHVMRARARSAVTNLARLAPRGGYAVDERGEAHYVPLDRIRPGMQLLLRAGDRLPVDCVLLSPHAELDMALVNGEPLPAPMQQGAVLPAGATNMGYAVMAESVRPASDSFLARTTALMEAAEATRTRYRRLADRAAEFYAPAVHLLAAATFAGWLVAGGDWHQALLNAVAVLIVTCPCALALAVPIVHVVAAERLLRHGILMRDGGALERLADVRAVALDKTGTLTEGRPRLVSATASEGLLAIAARLASASSHPLSQAIAAAVSPAAESVAVVEHAGQGVEATIDGARFRLGSAPFCGATETVEGSRSTVWMSRDGQTVAAFTFDDALRADAVAATGELVASGLWVEVLSGDAASPVRRVAESVHAHHWGAGLRPEDKLRRIEALRQERGGVVMVGDGINDAAALRAADVSFAPGAAADVGRAAADFVLTRNDLAGVPFAYSVARNADKLVRQNLWFSVLYNAVVLPLAAAGMVTPLIAAVAMSSSSIIVVLNSLRLRAVQPRVAGGNGEAMP